ncbi:hypothetical protein RXV86_11410 [Alisedimentitalea sp. MJ-SS2]|uniref:hypothetical protein n=1 Tax=Aliisedimentitalea sp. MJ-SS2 TaxID=3049795 RepID=UPI00291119CC|nr:hypothetical protein [Alisedimentitalea sp. MJ-SS2]MDU8927993.1 hypothetical protein [Alisedimentitalea sp. MJ-SS2]
MSDALPNQEPQLPIHLLTEEEDLVTWAHCADSDRLVLSFSGIGVEEKGVPPYEFAKIATGEGRDNVLFISDPNRSWLNGKGLIDRIVKLARKFAEEMGAKEIVTLGHSMGGYAAIILSGFLPVKSAVALAPQYSVHPEVTGDDERWMNWREQITTHRIRSVEEHLSDDTMYHVFHGMHGRERPQRDRFPVRHNLYHTIMPRTVHNVPQRLKRFELLYEIVQLGFENKPKQMRIAMEPLRGFRRNVDQFPVLAPSSEVSS